MTKRFERPNFYRAEDYPGLAEVVAQWPAIREEAMLTLSTLEKQLGDKVGPSWILPLVPEYEDEPVLGPEVSEAARALAPLTVGLVGKLPYVVAYAFSKLAPGTKIPEHDHWNPYYTAMLCLQNGGGSHLVVDGERRDFVQGKVFVFDYTLPHEVKNEGHEDRLVLLMLVQRLARAES